MSTPAPRRFELYEPYRPGQLGQAGTTVIRLAAVYGRGARYRTISPCCGRPSHVDAVDAAFAGVGAHVTCAGCGWKWTVHLCRPGAEPGPGERLRDLPDGATHREIRADRAEWVSRGFGTRRHHRRTT